MFRKIVHDRTADTVVSQIEDLVLDGVLRPGDRLPAERELSVELDVSRPILRAALKDLESRHLVASRPGEGTYIAEILGHRLQGAPSASHGRTSISTRILARRRRS